jgi:hypothetical protein
MLTEDISVNSKRASEQAISETPESAPMRQWARLKHRAVVGSKNGQDEELASKKNIS